MASRGSSAQGEKRVVLLGGKGAGKTSLANRLIGGEVFSTEETQHCAQQEGEDAGKKLIVVDTPGWERGSAHRTSEHLKQEIIRSPTFCLPGPHALLLVLPISISGKPPSADEIESAIHHVELLSSRAWRHIIVLFVCQDEVDKSVTDQHVQGAKTLIDKCEGRHFILHRDSSVSALLQTLDSMIKDNCGDFLRTQISYDVFEKQHEELKQWCKSKMERMEQEFQKKVDSLEEELNDYRTGTPRARSESFTWIPPNMTETPTDRAPVQDEDPEEMVGLETVSLRYQKEIMTILRYYMKPIGVILMAFVGALLGSIVGALDCVKGSCVGKIFGSMIGALLAIVFMRSTRLVRSSAGVALVLEGREQTRPRTGSHREKPKKTVT